MRADHCEQLNYTRDAKIRRISSSMADEIAFIQEQAYRLGQDSKAFECGTVGLIRANVENPKLSDKEFREFVIRILEG